MWRIFLLNLDTYRPRDYIVENLSPEKQAIVLKNILFNVTL